MSRFVVDQNRLDFDIKQKMRAGGEARAPVQQPLGEIPIDRFAVATEKKKRRAWFGEKSERAKLLRGTILK